MTDIKLNIHFFIHLYVYYNAIISTWFKKFSNWVIYFYYFSSSSFDQKLFPYSSVQSFFGQMTSQFLPLYCSLCPFSA